MMKFNISDKITGYRKKHGLSLVKFSEIVKVSPQAVYKWEHEICYPSVTMLPELAEILGCTVNDFFEDNK